MKNAAAKSFKQMDKLIKRDQVYICQIKDVKTNMQQGFLGFVKAGKINKKKQTSFWMRITKYQEVQQWNKFARFYYYPCYSKMNNIVTDLLILIISILAKRFTEG